MQLIKWTTIGKLLQASSFITQNAVERAAQDGVISMVTEKDV